MPFFLTQGAEPIPGYQLVKKLGLGGYGEVWKATAPGGLAKAIKVIFGETADFRAEQELKALNRIKEVRHPFLLSLERVEITANQVFVVMELADGSLMDRFEECRRAGLPGIPREELLQHLLDAADALDYMSANYGLQHLDIKPQNLLLVGGRIKIADFGLVKDLCGTSVTATGGVTPLYASPEAFDGKVSRFSDQYSLAIVYQEMLTGSRPFPGKTTLQLAFQHINSAPLLDLLPAWDRAIIGRSLAKIPDQRFPTCRDMVDQLKRPPQAAPLPPAAVAAPVPRAAGQFASLTPEAVAVRTPDEAQSILDLETMVGPAVSPPRPTPALKPVVRPKPEPARREWPARSDDVQLRPTLFLGIGGLAGSALRRLRARLTCRFGDLSRVPIFQFALLDTDRAGLRSAQQGKPGEALSSDETLLLPLHRPEHYRTRSRDLLQWLDRRWLFGIPRSQLTEGMRSLGRLAFVDHADEVETHLRKALTRLVDPEARAATAAAVNLAVSAEPPRVFLLAGVSGGTGGGMVFDLAYTVRRILGEWDLSGEGLCGLLLHATGPIPAAAELARINTYATLTELNHFSQDEDGRGKPFEDCYLLHLGDQLDEAQMDAATDGLAEYLYLNSATPVGAVLDQYRGQYSASPTTEGEAMLRTFNLTQIVFPKHRLAAAAGAKLCQRLVDHWLGVMAPTDEEPLAAAAQDAMATLGLEAEALTDRFHAAAKQVLGADPGTFFGKFCSDWDQNPPIQKGDQPHEIARLTHDLIVSHLGEARDPNESNGSSTSARVASALEKQARELGVELGREMAAWLKTIFENPEWRLKATEWAADYLVQHCTGVMESAGSLLIQYQTKRASLFQRLIAEGENKTAGTWFGIGRRQGESGQIRSIFLELCWLRLKELVMESALSVFKAVAGNIAQFNQNLALYREKLVHFAATLAPGRNPSQETASSLPFVPGRMELFPDQAQSLEEAVVVLLRDLPPDFIGRFDHQFQSEVLDSHGGLWEAIGKALNPADRLREELETRSRAALLEELRDTNAADLFIESFDSREQAEQALEAYLRKTAPRSFAAEGVLHYVVALPHGSAGESLSELAAKTCTGFSHTIVKTEEDLRICCEAAYLPIATVAAGLIGPDLDSIELARQVLTRTDVRWTPLAVG